MLVSLPIRRTDLSGWYFLVTHQSLPQAVSLSEAIFLDIANLIKMVLDLYSYEVGLQFKFNSKYTK